MVFSYAPAEGQVLRSESVGQRLTINANTNQHAVRGEVMLNHPVGPTIHPIGVGLAAVGHDMS